MSVRIEAHAEPIPGYKLLDRLGAGGFGEVWRCEAPGGIFKAVKIIHGDLRSRDNDLIRYAEQELKALKRVKMVRHPYLLALDRYDIVEGRLMIVMELADCNLWDRFRECRNKGLPGIPRDELMMYMAETAEVLDLMNDQHQLQHLDIKPQNLFMIHNHVKVADFGQVKDLQGIMADVTGGITPVYAAPETFDGKVTRFCDQYSLACVYQELLTGIRPFDGASMSQLLMQHLNLPPNLDPSPRCDRPMLDRALAKKPEDRWPNVAAFVKGLREAPEARASEFGPRFVPVSGDRSTSIVRPEMRVPQISETPFPKSLTETDSHQPIFTPAPPEVSGPGPLHPALVIGVGQAGLRVLQRLRYDLGERYGPPANTPLVRTLFIDTDPEALEDAVVPRPFERLAGLEKDQVFAAKLNRASHYLKPRLNGRSLIEGWFDPQLLYKIPRVPQTMGLRLFGRLAFCDHYRPLVGKIHAELDACLAPDSLHLTEQRTGLRRRTNRPRVYVVAGIAGGTGSGMFLDLAYTLQSRLRRMGYENPEVIGLLIVPTADASITPPQALGNTYAALTELNHYSRPESVFTASYDDRHGQVQEKDPPFTRCLVLPGTAVGLLASRTASTGSRTPVTITAPMVRPRTPGAGSGTIPKPGSRPIPSAAVVRDPADTAAAFKPYSDAADFLRLSLFSPIGRAADETRAAHEEEASRAGVRVGSFGVSAFDWPRAEVVVRAAAKVARAIFKGWIAPNVKRAREVVPTWAANRWTQLGLDPDTVLGHLQTAAEGAVGGKIEELISLTTEPLIPRGWLARLPEPDKLTVAQDRLVKLLGPPTAGIKRPMSHLEEAVNTTAARAADGFTSDLSTLGPALVDDPQFRLAGAEEVLRQFLATTDRLLERFIQQATDADAKAQAGYECLAQYAHFQKGMRKPTATEFAEALRQWPRVRFQALTYRQLAEIYRAIRDVLAAQLGEVVGCKQRFEGVSVPNLEAETAGFGVGPRQLMPPGCPSVADAVQRFLGVLTETDQVEIDRRVQVALEADRGGLFQACLNSASGAEGVVGTLCEEARAYLDGRLGEVDMGAMFAERFRSRPLATRAVEQAFHEADPGWAGNGPWAATEVVVVGAPGGPAGEPVRELLRGSIPVAGLPVVDSRDDVTVYREHPHVPLSALPHLGSAGVVAYQSLPEATQCSLHARLDVTQWAAVDSE